MLDKNIGYVICESATEKKESAIISDNGNKVVIEAILQDMNCLNRNGRYYSSKELVPELTSTRTKELLRTGNLKSESGHPTSKELSRQSTIDPSNVVCKIMKLWTDGDDIKAHVTGCNNALGKEFNEDILEGELPSFSLRALGSIVSTNKGNEVKNIKIITWDKVIYPSHAKAYMSKIVNESTCIDGKYAESDKGILIPITNQKVIDYIKTESTNLKNVIESFELLYESIDVVDNGRRVQLVDNNGSMLVINLETYISNEIMNYSYKNY